MKNLLKKLSLSVLLMTSQLTASADVVVLVHGYLGDVGSWQESGVTRALETHGWQMNSRQLDSKSYYLVNLPSEAPIDVQAEFLKKSLAYVTTDHPDERLILIGHSAGGVVARTVMVKNTDIKIYGLIAIASPNLGTNKAEQALGVSQTPVSMFAPMMGAGTLNRSRQLYRDLVRERPGNFLHWLNNQDHPDAKYISLIRSTETGNSGDSIVPVYSQDLRNVTKLKEVAQSYRIDSGHQLSRRDGDVIVGLLNTML
jgi:triacylglycerol lipase